MPLDAWLSCFFKSFLWRWYLLRQILIVRAHRGSLLWHRYHWRSFQIDDTPVLLIPLYATFRKVRSSFVRCTLCPFWISLQFFPLKLGLNPLRTFPKNGPPCPCYFLDVSAERWSNHVPFSECASHSRSHPHAWEKQPPFVLTSQGPTAVSTVGASSILSTSENANRRHCCVKTLHEARL